MEVAFAPKGQTADQYILEQVELTQNKKILIVVTNDRSLKLHANSFGAKTMSIQAFLNWLMKRKKQKKSKKSVIRESPAQIERLVKIFEETLKNLDREE
jgi:predicted RNA-binding protein with PIN domain